MCQMRKIKYPDAFLGSKVPISAEKPASINPADRLCTSSVSGSEEGKLHEKYPPVDIYVGTSLICAVFHIVL